MKTSLTGRRLRIAGPGRAAAVAGARIVGLGVSVPAAAFAASTHPAGAPAPDALAPAAACITVPSSKKYTVVYNQLTGTTTVGSLQVGAPSGAGIQTLAAPAPRQRDQRRQAEPRPGRVVLLRRNHLW